jgi:O-antigen/teichoic acid export membrane protein
MLGRKTFLSVISLLFIRLIQGIILIFAVNRFLPIEFGYVTVAQSLLAFFLFFSDLNLSTVHLKLMAEEEEKSVAFSTYFFLKIFLIIISSITFIFIIFFSLNSNLITNNQNQISIIIVVFIDRLIISMLMVYNYSFQATFKIAKKEVATIIGQIFGLIFGLISILILNNFILYLVNTIISNLFALSISIYYGRDFKLTKIKKDLLVKYFKLDLVFILPFFISVLIANLGPLLFLQYYNEELLGVFNVITSFFLMIKGIEQVFRSLLIPKFSQLYKNNQFDEIRKSIVLFEKYTAILNGIIIVIGIFFADYFLKLLFGQIYFENGLFLYFGYLISLISFSLFGPYTPLIVVLEKFKVYTFNLFISLIFSITSWIFLLPFLNILAIKLGLWISIIPQTIFIRYYCFKYFKTGKLNLNNALNLVVIFSLILVSFYFFSLNFSFLLRIFISLFILILYLGFLISTKILTRDDFTYFINVINPKKMLDYIKEETIND